MICGAGLMTTLHPTQRAGPYTAEGESRVVNREVVATDLVGTLAIPLTAPVTFL